MLHPIFLALVLSSVIPVPDAAGRLSSVASCRVRDEYADAMIGSLQQLVTSTDPEDVVRRNSLGIPATTAANVTYVTTEQVCSKVASVFAANVGVDNGPPVSGVVYVVKVANVYVVDDPSQKMGHFSIRMVITDKFKYVSQYM